MGVMVTGSTLTTAGLDDLTALPDHGSNGTAQHVWTQMLAFESQVPHNISRVLTGDEGRVERLASKVLVVLLEVLLGGSDELDGSKLKAVHNLAFFCMCQVEGRGQTRAARSG